MERFVDKIQKGNIFCVGARPFVDKAQFCIGVASLFASKGNKVLYISHEMDEDTFTEKLNTTCSNVGDNINFEEVYKLTIEGLEMFASEDDYSLIVLDPFDIYSLDLDIGDLKEFAKKKNIAILLTTNLARPPVDDNRTHPVIPPSDSTPSDVEKHYIQPRFAFYSLNSYPLFKQVLEFSLKHTGYVI